MPGLLFSVADLVNTVIGEVAAKPANPGIVGDHRILYEKVLAKTYNIGGVKQRFDFGDYPVAGIGLLPALFITDLIPGFVPVLFVGSFGQPWLGSGFSAEVRIFRIVSF